MSDHSNDRDQQELILADEKAARSLLDQLLDDSRLYRTSQDYKNLLGFVARLRNFAPFNAMLLQVQKPGLSYAASARDWRERFERQGKLPTPSFLAQDIAGKALELFRQNYTWDRPIRSLGVRGADLVTEHGAVQLDMVAPDSAEQEQLERTVDRLRERFGPYCVRRCALLQDDRLTGFNPKDDHVIHPVSFFR